MTLAAESAVGSVAWSPDGETLCTASTVVELWNPSTGARLENLGHGRVAAFADDGRSLAIAFDDTVRVIRLPAPTANCGGSPIPPRCGRWPSALMGDWWPRETSRARPARSN